MIKFCTVLDKQPSSYYYFFFLLGLYEGMMDA